MKTLVSAIQKDGVAVKTNKTLTENFALTNASTLNKVLDWFSNAGAMRGRLETDITKLFVDAYIADHALSVKSLFYFRDVRGGQGERRLFRVALKWLASQNPPLVSANLENIPFFGRWDDLFVLFDTPVEKDMLEFVSAQFEKDMRDLKEGTKSISLLGKWLPSINTSSEETVKLGHKFRHAFSLREREYRRALSSLRAKINIVERQMCANEWESIDFNIIPSRASLLYRDAFKKHDATRYVKWQADVASGKKGAKVNAAALYPYDIVRSVLVSDFAKDLTTPDLQWKALPNYLEDNPHNGLVVCDVSGSMMSMTGSSRAGVRPIDISISLAIYMGERMNGKFKNHFITFSEQPTLQKIEGETIYAKVHNLAAAHWNLNTDLQAVFDLILDTAKRHRLPQSEMPDVIYIVSDMEFDQASRNNNQTNYEAMKRKFANEGYKMPKTIWWKVNALSNQVPVTKDEIGTILVSGCSPSVLRSLLSGKTITPLMTMLEVLNQERYARVKVNIVYPIKRKKVAVKKMAKKRVTKRKD